MAGLRHVGEAAPLLPVFQAMIRLMIGQQRQLQPDPRTVVDGMVTGKEAGLLIFEPRTRRGVFPDAQMRKSDNTLAMRKVRQLLGHEPFLYNVVYQPQQSVQQKSVRVPPVVRASRRIESIDGYLDRVLELVVPAELPSVPPQPRPLDILPGSLTALESVLGSCWQ